LPYRRADSNTSNNELIKTKQELSKRYLPKQWNTDLIIFNRKYTS